MREALVNTLVHADYTGRLSVLVVKRPNMFGFLNPGGLRLPVEQVIRGGESDCRNRTLHQMFLLIGLGERGGSGIPKIFSGWQSQHWRQPLLREKDLPEQTLLKLHMLDLLPESVLNTLRGMLQSQGRSRDKVYYLSGSAPVSPEQVFVSVTSSGNNETAKDLTTTTGTESLHRNEQDCLISPLLDAPIIDSLAVLSPS